MKTGNSTADVYRLSLYLKTFLRQQTTLVQATLDAWNLHAANQVCLTTDNGTSHVSMNYFSILNLRHILK